MSIGGGGGTQTSTTVNQADPRIWDTVSRNVDRATGIANQGFQAYTGNPYAGLTTGGTPGTPGYYTGGEFTGYDEYGQPQYNPSQWVEGTPGTPGTTPTFNASNFVAPLTANQNMAINAAPNLLNAGQGATNAAVSGAAGLLNYRPQSIMPATANTNTAQASGYNASLLGAAPQMQAANANGVTAGPAATAGYSDAGVTNAQAANMNRGDVQNLNAQTGAQGMSNYQNPYQQQVIDAALGDIERSRQQAIGSNQDAAIAARAFGGSRQGVADALTNEAYGRTAANTAANLRAQGFDTAAALGQQDASRNLQAQSANQGADLSVAAQNAANSQQAGLANASAANQIGLSNAANRLNAGQFNAGAINSLGQFNAGLLTGVNQYNAGNQQAANATNTGLLSQYGMANQNALNQAGQYNAGNQQAVNLANAATLNQGNQFNAGVLNAAQAQNQQAGLSGAQINAGAAGLLGNLGQQQQSMYGTGLSGLLQTGALGQQNQQAALDAAYQEFLRQINQPYTGQSLINQSLGLLPQGGTQTTTAPKQGGGLLDGLLGIGATAGALGWAPFSDSRLKENVRFDGHDDMGRAWYTYNYIWDEPDNRQRGVMAQEILSSDPDAVIVDKNTGFFRVDYSKLVRH